MNNQEKQYTDDFVKRAQARIEQMKQSAQELTKALSLPRESTYDVLATIATQAPLEAPLEEQTEQDTVSSQLRSQPLPFDVGARFIAPSGNVSSFMQQPGKAQKERKQPTNSGFPNPHGKARYWISTLAAGILIAVLVGSLVLVLNIAKQNKIGSQPSGPDQAGLYAAASDGVYRLAESNSKLTQRWYYKLSAPRSKEAVNSEKAPYPLSFSLIDTPVTVVNDVAYFGGLEEDKSHNPHHYLYALNTANGSLLWRHQIDGDGSGIQSPEIITTRNTISINLAPGRAINAPQVWHDMVFINVSSSPGDNYVIALARSNGAVRWTYKYPVNKLLAVSGQMAPIENSLIYIANGNTLFALRADNGHRQWVAHVPQQTLPGHHLVVWQTFQTPQISDGVIYVAYAVQGDGPATSSIYAFNAANGSQIWHSQPVDDLITPLTVTQGVVYFATQTTWHVYALRAQDGRLLWDYNTGNPVSAPPQVMNGVVYVIASTPGSSSPTAPGQMQSIIALDTTHGTHLWTFQLHLNIPFDFQGQLAAGQDVIYVSANNIVYSLRASNGSLIQAFPLGTSVPARLTLVP